MRMGSCSALSGWLELLRKATTASEVAGAAQAFGQEDDISVIAVTRETVAEPALA